MIVKYHWVLKKIVMLVSVEVIFGVKALIHLFTY